MDELEPNRTTHPGGSPEPPSPPAPPSLEKVHTVFLGPEGLRPGWGVFLYLGMSAILFFILVGLNRLVASRSAGFLWAQLVTNVVLVVASLVPAVVMGAIEKRPFAAYGLPPQNAFGRHFWIGVAWGMGALAVLMLAMRGLGVFSFGHLALHGIRIFKFAAFWGVLFLLVGFFEEFVFRGYTLHNLSRAIGFWPAAWVFSIIFGALHLANQGEAWLGGLAAGGIGLFFCFTLRRTGSLWFAVGMHASWDWGESYLYSVPDSGGVVTGHLLNSSVHGSRWLTGGSVGPEGSVLVFVVVGLAWVVFDRMYPGSQSCRRN
ncbi:MAG: CPBP family intramembrane metalloprotease [Acidobacteriia bacterium]|nr:CPBP family intramembrane metalloprotease [Terriglobia bacterium]